MPKRSSVYDNLRHFELQDETVIHSFTSILEARNNPPHTLQAHRVIERIDGGRSNFEQESWRIFKAVCSVFNTFSRRMLQHTLG